MIKNSCEVDNIRTMPFQEKINTRMVICTRKFVTRTVDIQNITDSSFLKLTALTWKKERQ